MNLWKLELLRLQRTWRGPGLLVVFLLFGVLGPITARYMELILGSLSTDGVEITFPAPVPADGMIQYLGNAQQVGLIAVIAAEIARPSSLSYGTPICMRREPRFA